ncbi:Pentatricopeptide repeat-containing protein [Artemisia annua]|uniref:Pentatricopeptide repeat-containing protein n=1 Tax=Artemisia annua TaxID=35608 RepID=A0A2U1PEF2_ARTAN|nr:Pentatricopeptide repeat-containing protein [Artemisia annua]
MSLSSHISRLKKLTNPVITQTHFQIRTITQSKPKPKPKPKPKSKPSFRELKTHLKSEQDPTKLASLFESSLSIPTFRRYRPLFTLSVQKLTDSKRFDLIDRILTQTVMESKDPLLGTEGMWVRIAMLYSQAGMVDNALKVFDEMLERKPWDFGEKSLCGVLSVLVHNGIFGERLDKVFEEYVKRTGYKPGVKAYNMLVKGYMKGGRLGDAEELVRKMESGEIGVKPDICSYNDLLEEYFSNGKKSEFDAMVKRIDEMRIKGDRTSYKYRILRHCEKKEYVVAREMLHDMFYLRSVKPDPSSYHAVIFGFCKVGDLENAQDVLKQMVENGFEKLACFGYFTIYKHMVEVGEFDGALGLCKDIIRMKWVPPFEATKLLVSGLVKNSKSDAAREVVGSFKKRLKGPALESWEKIEATLPL